MNDDCHIIGVDVITSLGAGVDAVWDEMMSMKCGIRPMNRFPRGKYQTDLAAEIPSDVITRI